MQTGPAMRNDQVTIDKHLGMLTNYPELRGVYELLTEQIIRFAQKLGNSARRQESILACADYILYPCIFWNSLFGARRFLLFFLFGLECVCNLCRFVSI